jgi:hypothetical protein
MTLSYDKHGDVLYISFETLPPDAYIVVENELGDILKLDKRTKRVIGCTIPSLKRRFAQGKIQIPEIGSVSLNAIVESLFANEKR